MRNAYNILRGRRLGTRSDRCVLTCEPDVTLIAQIRAKKRRCREIVYPGPGLAADLRQELGRVFQSVRLTTYDDMEIRDARHEQAPP